MNRGTGRIAGHLILAIFVAATLAAESIPELFQQGKEQFKAKSYAQSLETFNRLDEASRQPGFEVDRAKLEPVIAFYRGVNLAMLGQKDFAIGEFEKYLSFTSNVALDSTLYPKQIIDVFDTARKNVAKRDKESSVAGSYARFRPEPGKDRVVVDERWSESVVRYLLSDEEKAEWAKLTTQADREAFVDSFWKKRDPTPESPANEFRSEFERRLLFSDAAFGSEQQPGRETDRALVFVLFGPPTYIGQAQLQAENDPMEMMRAQAPKSSALGTSNPEATSGKIATPAKAAPSKLQTDNQREMQEAWYYRGKQIPPSIKFNELKFDFIGPDLQKYSRILSAIGQAAKDAGTNVRSK